MLDRREMTELKKEVLIINDSDAYWPRWLRNAMAQVVASIQIEDPIHKEKLEHLQKTLQLPIAQCPDLLPEEKRLACRLFKWFSCRDDRLMPLTDEIREISGNSGESCFSFAHPEDMFSDYRGGFLVPSLDNALHEIYRKLGLPIAWATVRSCETPLTLFAADKDKLTALRDAIPSSFHPFCAFEINAGVGTVVLE